MILCLISYFISYNFLGSNDQGQDPAVKNNRQVTFNYPCSNDNSCAPYAIKFSPGIYNISLCGAKGGDAYKSNNFIENSAGNGNCVEANLELFKNTQMYLYVGGKGTNQGSTGLGGWNNGGNGFGECSGGGGSTDLRLVYNSGSNELLSLTSRIIVASGGGGGCFNASSMYHTGSNGGDVNGTSPNPEGDYAIQKGIKQYFGKALNGTADYPIAGSGGGYYGGYAVIINESFTGGFGGNSFVSGANNCIAVSENGDYLITNVHYSGLKFSDINMNKLHNDGAGYAIISLVKDYSNRMSTERFNLQINREAFRKSNVYREH